MAKSGLMTHDCTLHQLTLPHHEATHQVGEEDVEVKCVDVNAFSEVGPCSNTDPSIGECLFDGMGSINSWL